MQSAECKTQNADAAGAKLVRKRVRIRFTKEGDLRWISHRDLMRLWERLFRRAGVALSMTEGFHPKPRINFPSALAVGIAGLDELLEVDLAEDRSADSLVEAIAGELPRGMSVKAIEMLPAPDRKAQVTFVMFQMPVPTHHWDKLGERIAWLLRQESVPIQREGRKNPLDLRPLIADLQLVDGALRMRLRVDREGSARPREVLQALEIEDLEYEGFFLTRTRVEAE
jgi:radical SAM-linked protein